MSTCACASAAHVCLLCAAVRAIATNQVSSSSSSCERPRVGYFPEGLEGHQVDEEAKVLAVPSLVVAGVLDDIARGIEAAAKGKPGAAAAAAKGSQATKGVDTLTNLSAYLLLHRAKSQGSFNPVAAGVSEKEATEVALVFYQVGAVWSCGLLPLLLLVAAWDGAGRMW